MPKHADTSATGCSGNAEAVENMLSFTGAFNQGAPQGDICSAVCQEVASATIEKCKRDAMEYDPPTSIRRLSKQEQELGSQSDRS